MDSGTYDSPIRIRAAALRDLSDIAELERLTSSEPWSEASLRHDLLENDRAVMLAAEWEGAFAGYADLWCIPGEGQLNNIAVLPLYRGRGIGRALLEALIAILRENAAEEMTLEVRSGNAPAIHLYEKLGFVTAGIRKGYYLDNGEDARLMTLTLAARESQEEGSA